MPGITGTSPSAFTSVRTTATFSSKDRVALSPSEPSGTMPMQPASTCHCACLARKAWSTWPSSVKGVVIAGITPCHMLLLISQLLGLTRWMGVAETGQHLQRHGKDRGPEAAPGYAPRLAALPAADTALAGAQAAAGHQPGLAAGRVARERGHRAALAAAADGVGPGQRMQ